MLYSAPVDSYRNLGVIFDKNMSFTQHISSISISCFLNIRDLGHIRNTIDQTTACTIATSLIHSKIDYCNSHQLNLPATQTNRLQLVLNSAARAVTKTPIFITLLLFLNLFPPLRKNQTSYSCESYGTNICSYMIKGCCIQRSDAITLECLRTPVIQLLGGGGLWCFHALRMLEQSIER